jgi:seryl-tRNA synthetase
MLDINYIRSNKEKVKKIAKDKNIEVDIEKLIKLDSQRKDIKIRIEKLREERNNIASQIGKYYADGKTKEADKLKLKAEAIKKMLQDIEPEYREIDENILEISLHIPNIYSKDTPIGADATKNVVVYQSDKPKKMDFPISDHIQLGKKLDILDLERGVKVSGFRGYYLKNEGAILHMALMQYAFHKMVQKGFSPMIVPTLVHKHSLIGSGHFPFGKDEIYQIANPGKLADGSKITENTYLVGTAEPSLLAYRMDEIIEEKELPIKMCGFSQCYRSEVGSYGKDTKGLFRLHEFSKVEQVIICKDDPYQTDKLFEELRQNAEEILKDLDLSYQVIQICTGDMGAGKYKMYDIETWMPSLGKYAETHSNSNLTDWQTRRLNIRYKNQSGEKIYPYALNNTALASPRIIIALLENHQQKDGSIKIPQVLHKYCGFTKISK